jgi:hypothetical protein
MVLYKFNMMGAMYSCEGRKLTMVPLYTTVDTFMLLSPSLLSSLFMFYMVGMILLVSLATTLLPTMRLKKEIPEKSWMLF